MSGTSGSSGRGDRAALAQAQRALRQELRLARGKARLDLILEAPDPRALVRSLPADELYFAIEEIGLADAAPLVRLAGPGQFRTFIDLDAWRKGELDPRRVLPWLRAARAGSQRDEEAERSWRAKLAAVDMEILELVLRGTIRVHDLEADPDPELSGNRALRTAEGKFAVEFLVDGVEYLAVNGLIDALYAEDAFRAGRLLSAIRWELPSELEETARRWREGRLHDLGYPPFEEALSWYARPPRGSGAPPGQPARSAGFFLDVRPPGSVLERASARLGDEEREALELQLVAAANAAMVADAVDPSDLDAVRRSVDSSRALVELGLGALAGGDPERAAEALAQTPVKTLFQRGFGRLLDLKKRAEQVRVTISEKGLSLGPPLDELLAALVRKRPRYFPGIELPREEWGSPAAGAFEPRAFLSEGEVGRTEEALREAERQAA